MTDQPETPSLTMNVKDPKEGDYLELICITKTDGMTSYKFYKDGNHINSTGNSNRYTIGEAPLGVQDGNYSCVALINSVTSNISSDLAVTGKIYIHSNSPYLTHFICVYVWCCSIALV